MGTITQISKKINLLHAKDKALLKDLYSITTDTGELVLPESMKGWVKKTFGSAKVVEKQTIVRIDNNYTLESAAYNSLRSKRPIQVKDDTDTQSIIKDNEGGPFCTPKKGTPSDPFGRVQGKHCISASNIAKYDVAHGLIIFKQHNPLQATQQEVKDYAKTAQRWIEKAYKKGNDKNRKYPYLMWNCLYKAASSIVHGHMQIVIGKGRHYPEIERLRRVIIDYSEEKGRDYLTDVFKAHEALGLGFKKGKNKYIVHMTPKKDKEIMVISPDIESASTGLFKAFKSFRDMGVESFNAGMYLNPLDEEWTLPVITRIVDRGSLHKKTTDIGGMEMFAGTNVIETDPYKVMEFLKKRA